MKPNRCYLLFLCLFFLKGYGHALAVVPAHSFSSIPLQVTHSENPTAFDYCQDYYVLSEYALLSGDDDDDDDSVPARKKTLISSYSTLHTIFFLSDLSLYYHNYRRSNGCFGYLTPGRYIFQRVLRV
jgi:hypothetical protein